MKRLLIGLCLLSMILIPCSVHAEWELPVINEDFSFRNGITVGMSMDEVLSIEKKSGNSASKTNKSNNIEVEDISFLGQDHVQLDYYFTKDKKLSSFTYSDLGYFYVERSNYLAYINDSYYKFSDLKDILVAKYGEPMLTTKLSPFSTALWNEEFYYIDYMGEWSADTLSGKATFGIRRSGNIYVTDYAVWVIKYNDCAVVVELGEANNGKYVGLGYALISHEAMEPWVSSFMQEQESNKEATEASFANDI